MTMTTTVRVLAGLLFAAFDLVLALVCLGFYSPSLDFNLDLVYQNLFLLDGYSFKNSPIDFVFLALVRSVLVCTGSLLLALGRQDAAKNLSLPVLGISVVSYSYSLAKMLAMSESDRLSEWGMWLSLAESLVAAVLLSSLWWILLARQTIPYTRLGEEDNSTSTETETRLTTGQHILRLLSYCGKQWPWFLSGFAFLVVYSAARVVIPLLTGQVISAIVTKEGFEVLVRSVLIMSALTAVSTLFGGLRGGCFDYATALVARQVRLDLFSSLARQDIAFFDSNKSGDMLSRLTTDCQTVASTISTNLNVFTRNGVMLVGGLVFMFVLSWRLTFITFIAIPLVAYITKIYGAYYDKLSEKTQATLARANEKAEEVLSTMRTVRSFACETREVRRFESLLDETLQVNRKRAVAYMGYTWTNEFCDNAILVAVLFYGGHLVLSGLMTPQNLVSFLLYQMQLGENLYNIGYVITGLMECVGASRKVFEFMTRRPTIPNDGIEKPPVNGAISIKEVNFTYPSRQNNPVLKGLNLSFSAGETVALVGPSGGGKSSIVSLLEHFYEPQQGRILLDGVDISRFDHLYYHQKVSLVAQEPVLYDGSVRSNILYGCDWATEEDMLNAAKMANVHGFVSELEKGYDTNCGEKGVQMSGGQKQRIAIARALVRRPALLILDEATSALDAESEALVQEALARCRHERTVLVIAHRLSTIEKADRILVINKGQLVQEGNHVHLMEDRDGLYYSLVSRQLLGASD